MSFIYVADGIDDVLAAHLNQYADAWSGVAGKGQPFNAVAVNDPINFAISARNLDPTNSRAAQFLKADGTVLFQCDASGVKVSPDGTVASVPVTATSTQTLTNKTLTSPHMTGPVVDSGGLTVTVPPVIIGSGNVATVGSMRFPNNVAIAWRSPANTTDQAFYVNGSSQFVFGDAGAGIATATTATAGALALPANPAGFLNVVVNGTTQKIPYYNN